MRRRTGPAPGMGQDLFSNRRGSDNSTTLSKPKGINHLKTLQEIADKWVNRGCYSSPGRALRALIGGEL